MAIILINNVGFDSYKSSLPTYSEALALKELAVSFGTVPSEDFEKEQKAIADERINRKKERVAKLKKSIHWATQQFDLTFVFKVSFLKRRHVKNTNTFRMLFWLKHAKGLFYLDVMNLARIIGDWE